LEVRLKPQAGLTTWQQRRITAYFEANLGRRITVAGAAGLVRLSPFHFARVFKQSFGVSPYRYHFLRRIERAKHLLADSGDPVAQIALMVGFSETSAFTSAFRRATGLAPSRYRIRAKIVAA
jgi:AraC family transcriptional regulator